MPTTVTNRLQGLTTSAAVKPPVKAVSTVNLTLAGEQTVNGVAVEEDDRVLAKDQTDASENGIYIVSTGAWSRAKDFDGELDVVKGTLVVSNNDTSIYYRVTSDDPIVIGTDDIDFEVVSGAITQSSIGAALYPTTDEENDAEVTPTNHVYPPGDIRRYGAVIDGDIYQALVSGWLAYGDLRAPEGDFDLSDTVIVGNNKRLIGAGSQLTRITVTSGFGTTDKKPMFALSENYDDPDHAAYDIDAFEMRGVTLVGNITLGTGSIPSDTTGVAGIDVTWTKDDIVLEDVYFDQLAYGVNKRDQTAADIVHWGLRVRGGGARSCYKGYHIFPSLGSIDEPDIQRCVFGIEVSSGNAFSSTVWLRNLRAEVNRATTVPSNASHVVLNSVKAYIDGYFEGSARHITISGGGNSHTTIGPSQFSKVNSGGTGSGSVDVPILWTPSGSQSSLTLIGVYGADSSNHEAFIEFGAHAGTLIWAGQGGNTGNIFKDMSANVAQYPPSGVTYFNPHAIRGGASLGAMEVYDDAPLWSKQSTGFYTKRYVRRVNPGTGTHTLVTFSGRCHGVLRASLQDATASSAGQYMHYVAEFYVRNDNTVVAVETVDVEASGSNSPAMQVNGATFELIIRNSGLSTCAVSLEVTCEASPDTIVTWSL